MGRRDVEARGHGATEHGRSERLNDDGREAAHNEGLFVAALNYHYNRCPRPRVTEPLL